MTTNTKIMQVMTKFLLAIVLVLASGSKCSGGVDVGKLEKVKDFLNSRITYLVVQEYVIEKGDDRYKKRLTELKPLIYRNEVTNAVNYELLKKSVDPRFPQAVKKLSALIDVIDERKFMTLSAQDAAQQLTDTAFAKIHVKYPEYEKGALKSKTAILEIITAYLSSEGLAPQVTSEPDTVISEEKSADLQAAILPEKAADHSEASPSSPSMQQGGFFSLQSFSCWNLLSILFCLATAGFVVWMFRRMDKKNDDLSNEALFFEAESNDDAPLPATVKKDKEELERELGNSDIIKRLSHEIADLKSLLTEKDNRINHQEITTAETPSPVVKTPPVNEEIFYMAGPVNNYFPTVAKSMSRENTVYRFILKGNKQEAGYEIHTTGAPVDEIVSMKESYIKPACNEENMPGSKVANIRTIARGTAILEGDKWVIKTKAIIRYE